MLSIVTYDKVIEKLMGLTSEYPRASIYSCIILQILDEIYPKANTDYALRVAAFACNIENANPETRLQESNYQDFASYRDDAALASANIVKDIMQELEISNEHIEDVFKLIRFQAASYDERSIALSSAAGLNFFRSTILFYKYNLHEVESACLWEYNRISKEFKNKCLDACIYYDDKMNALFSRIANFNVAS